MERHGNDAPTIPLLLVRQLHGATDVASLSEATIPTIKFSTCAVKAKEFSHDIINLDPPTRRDAPPSPVTGGGLRGTADRVAVPFHGEMSSFPPPPRGGGGVA